MAQETAGTIGIPVLKNEILPYLTDYAKRQERAELYKQKAAAAAAQKAAKEEKPVELDPTQYVGAGYDKYLKESYDTDLANAKAVIANSAATRQEKMEAAAKFKSEGEYRSKLTKQREEEWKSANNDINTRSLYTVPPTYYYQQTKDLPGIVPTEEIVKMAKSNPLQFLDFDKISKMSQGFAVRDVSLDTPDGKNKTQFKGSALFNYELVDDPNDVFGGRKVPVIKEVNGEVAKKFIAAKPELQQAFKDWTKNRSDEIIAAGNISGTIVDPTKAEEMAVDEFMKKSFPDAPIQYGLDVTPRTPRASGGGRGSKNIDFSASVGPSEAYTPVYNASGVEIAGAGQSFEVGDTSDKVVPLSTTNHPAGLKAIPMRKIETDDAALLASKGDGLYKLNRAFTYDNPKIRTVQRAKKDIDVTRNGRFAYRIKKGSIIGNDYAGFLIANGRDAEIYPQMGYQITARTKMPATDEEREFVFFVPDAEAGTIKANIAKFEKKKVEEETEEMDF